ncbi:hypothetical protein ELS19_10225 [Halogeometricum borinquense]|uniref:Ig-like domain-containing protein n=1 Tax=Halogeometricum borinquense TaxID=60847 RepID=A0A482TEU3_9EURY|nr:hypothetical protein ELS19_10225 [Halogeometricum borinquense]
MDLILKTEGEKSEVAYESTFTVDPNEQIREEDVVSASDYTYTVESDDVGSKEGIWRPDSNHKANTIVIEIKNNREKEFMHIMTISH